MTKIKIELPEATAKAAREAGLLTPKALDRLLSDAIRRRQAADSLLAVAAQADLVISGDADLLALGSDAGIRIVDAATAMTLIGG